MDLSRITVDVKALEEGEWKDHPYFDGVRVCVRGSDSEAYRKRRTQLLNRMTRKRMKTGDAIAAQLDLDRRARDVLVSGWDGITEGDEKVEYTPERAREWAADPAYARFFDGVWELAQDIGVESEIADEESLGN